MAKVIIDLSMSLDGFITGPNPTQEQGLGENGEALHEWYFNGPTASSRNEFFSPLGASMAVAEEMFDTTGAMVVGRSMYDLVGGWGGNHPIPGVQIFLVTHHAPERVPQGHSPITVVTDGIERAVAQAKAAAGDKNVTVGGAAIAQQCLNAGLVDEIYLHLVPVLLGGGTRLFEKLSAPLDLEQVAVIEAPGVTHLKYRVRPPAAE
jgi:dihydrofolate reductase